MRRVAPLGLIGIAAAVLAAAAWGGVTARERPLLGVAGKADRFERQTGQQSTVRHIFIGWEQGRSWGSPFHELLAGLRPVPMIHVGTDRKGIEAITPAGIAAGRGDPYLVALNRALADFGSQAFVRFLAEMNNPKNPYSPVDGHGRSRGASHSPAAYRAAFRRAYLILHGGDVDARLLALGQRPLGRKLPSNPPSRLTVIWNPIAGMDSGSRRPAQRFYPGDAFVDMVGNDMYSSSYGVASYAANEALYRAHPDKPYALSEWGTSVDDPTFVGRVCAFVKSHGRTWLAAYYAARRSPWDLADKPRARAAYRQCITPLGN